MSIDFKCQCCGYEGMGPITKTEYEEKNPPMINYRVIYSEKSGRYIAQRLMFWFIWGRITHWNNEAVTLKEAVEICKSDFKKRSKDKLKIVWRSNDYV